MKKSEKIARIVKILDELYPEPGIPLEHRDPYTLLVAVLLSAQCTDKRVNQVTPALFKLAKTPKKMALQDAAEIEKIIKPCGLAPRKSKNIKELSQLIIDRHQGKVPENFQDLEALPGVGHKTASVVMAQAFGVPAAPIDTHIHRLMERWKLSNGRSVEQTERDFKKCFPEQLWNKLHLQIIYFGREYCPARSHQSEKCPICSWVNLRSKNRTTRAS